MSALPIIRYAALEPTGDGHWNATILAPPDMPSGAAAGLADCINDQNGLTARAGFTGSDNQHVLRIQGLPHADALEELLHHTYPQWHKLHTPDAPMAPVEQPLEIVDADRLASHPYRNNIQRYLKNNASRIVSSCYSAGDIAMFVSGWNDQKDGYKMYSSAAYQTASTVLLLLSNHADDARSAEEITQQVHDILDAPAHARNAQSDNIIHKAANFVKHHPWESAAAISATGAVSYIASAMQKIDEATPADYVNLTAGIGTLVAMMLVSFSPPAKTMLNDEQYFQRKQGSMLETAEALARHPQRGDVLSQLQRAKDWIAEHPLQVASAVQTISNVNYGVSAVMAEPKDPTMIAASAAYVTGAISQAYADKHRHTSFDDIATIMSDQIRRDAASQSIYNVEARIDALTDELTKLSDVPYSSTAMQDGIRSRLQAATQTASPYHHLALQEWDIVKHSPFIDPDALQLSFAQRLEHQHALNDEMEHQR